jgi:hypothetical protein
MNINVGQKNLSQGGKGHGTGNGVSQGVGHGLMQEDTDKTHQQQDSTIWNIHKK